MRDGRAVSLLHIFPSFARGGQQMRLAAIAGALGEAYRHRIVSLDGDLSARSAFQGLDAEFETLALKKSRAVSLTNIGRFGRLLREQPADILCTYNFGALEAAIANDLIHRSAHIHYEDGFGADESVGGQLRRRVWARRLILRRSLVAVPSRTLAGLALHDWRLSPSRLRRIPNGIDVERFAVMRSARPLNAPATIGAIGALRPEKNFGRLLEAYGAVTASGARLIIYGDGPERDKLQAMAAAIGGDISFPGPTASPERAYAEFDIFALSSDTEQMPLTMMEAMAAGLPIAATDVGDVKEMAAKENREFIAAAGDDAAFAAALARLVDDPALRARLGAANAAKARAAFGLDAMISAHKALYAEALEGCRL